MEQTRFSEDWRRFSNSLRVSGGPCAVVLYKSSGVLVSRLSMAVASVRERWGSRAAGLSGGGESLRVLLTELGWYWTPRAER
ncbi:hypothetical protein F2Q68_00036256 [Brassica cretica]|uniref:Uncharacterized protein n=1 Tax=Brassica cretica TaxID=69181 RepID=A0A8S9H2Z6_BRACR|nr:hypothetical protein F2Q68_00036256 [Brassica cretica]